MYNILRNSKWNPVRSAAQIFQISSFLEHLIVVLPNSWTLEEEQGNPLGTNSSNNEHMVWGL